MTSIIELQSCKSIVNGAKPDNAMKLRIELCLGATCRKKEGSVKGPTLVIVIQIVLSFRKQLTPINV